MKESHWLSNQLLKIEYAPKSNQVYNYENSLNHVSKCWKRRKRGIIDNVQSK